METKDIRDCFCFFFDRLSARFVRFSLSSDPRLPGKRREKKRADFSPRIYVEDRIPTVLEFTAPGLLRPSSSLFFFSFFLFTPLLLHLSARRVAFTWRSASLFSFSLFLCCYRDPSSSSFSSVSFPSVLLRTFDAFDTASKSTQIEYLHGLQIAGGAALTVGIWLFADRNSFTNLIGKLDQSDILTKTDADVIKVISYILIIAGALTFIVSFLGYCGAMFESRCLLCIYGILLLLVLVLECVVVGLAFGLKGDAEKGSQDFLKSTIKYYAANLDKAETVTVAWDGIMKQFHCCGVESYLDFHKTANWTSTNNVVPEACCIKERGELKDRYCPLNPTSSNSYYQTGCYEAIINAVEENAAIVIGVAAGLVFVEVLVIILALYLACCYWRPQHACVDVSSRQAW